MNEKNTMQPLESRRILGTRVDATSYEDATARVLQWARDGQSHYVCVCNVHMVMEAHDAGGFQKLVNAADLVTPDGMPLVWVLRIMGIRRTPRVDGSTLTFHVCQAAAREGVPIALYGGSEETVAAFMVFARNNFPGIRIVDTISPPYRALTPEDVEADARKLAASEAKIVLVALGCPRQERWMAEHKPELNAVMIGIGAALDFHAGRVLRAPNWMQYSGMEWFFRLCMEPRRLWRRYLIHNPRFILLLLTQLLHLRNFNSDDRKRGGGIL
jgi:N-acetylglucosaminyldiphosphoundecaprenol N-acetyl-beta-D-mannosaminyltransferase